MARATSFVTGTVVEATWLNDLQELQSAAAWGLTVEKVSALGIRVAPSPDSSATGQSSATINGQPRYFTAELTHNVSATAGTYDIYLNRGAGNPPTLSSQVSGTAAPANARKLAEVVVSGGAITEVRNDVAAVSGHGWRHRAGGPDPVSFATSDPLVATSLRTTRNDALALDLPGAAAGITFGGDVNLYRSAVNVLTSDDQFRAVLGLYAGNFEGNVGSPSAGVVLNAAGYVTANRAVGMAAFLATVPGDTQYRWYMTTDGIMRWGDGAAIWDTNLYRSSPNTLKTDDHMLSAVGFMVDTASGQLAFRAVQAGGSGLLYNYLLPADANPSFAIRGDGAMFWGAGGATAQDTNLYRSAANSLKTDDTLYAFRLFLLEGAALANHAFITQMSADTQGRLAITAGGTLLFGPGNAALDVNLYRSAPNILKTDDDFQAASYAVGTTPLAAGHLSDGGDLARLSGDGYFTGNVSTGGVAASVGGAITGIFANSAGYIIANRSLGASALLLTVPGDAQYRWYISTDGNMRWGDGTNAIDTALWRESAGVLRTTDQLRLGLLYAQGGVENLRTLRGKVNADATIATGTGFTVAWTGSAYRITFSAAFAAAPSVVTSRVTGTNGNAEAWNETTTTVDIYTWDSSGVGGQKGPFSFIAIGPR